MGSYHMDSHSNKLYQAIIDSEFSDASESSMEEIHSWVDSQIKNTHVKVNIKDISALNGWKYDKDILFHETGSFFNIRGLKVHKNFNNESFQWDQPIIDQGEIGFLGFISKIINGSLHFLVQAKIEPGNVNVVQLSPTVQATKSNFTQAHKGNPTKYLEFFTSKNKKIIYDQLQSEQGARFFRKRNRNIIVYEQDIENTDPKFKWMTLKQIKLLMRQDNLINMDTRTVLSGMFTVYPVKEIIRSLPFVNSLKTPSSFFENACKKIVEMKFNMSLQTSFMPLNDMDGWICDEVSIRNLNDNFFEVIGIDVEIEGREVFNWNQPMIRPTQPGICVFFAKKINGILHFLCQFKVECGNLDIVEIAPSIQTLENQLDKIPYSEYIDHSSSEIYLDCFQSEEGGRFFQEENRNMIIVNNEIPNQVNEHFEWLSLNDLKIFIKYNNMINIQARNLLSTINIQDSL